MEQEYLDPLLIERIRDGENQAFKVVSDHLHERLAALARQLVSRIEDAEDAIAHGYLQLFIHRQRMESMNNVEGFLHETVRNYCLDLLRKEERRKNLWRLRPAWVARSERAVPENEADHRLLKAELAYCIRAVLDEMPENLRTAYQLYIVEELTAEEAGKKMGVSERTVRTYVQQAKERIHTAVIDKGLHILLIFCVLKFFLEKN